MEFVQICDRVETDAAGRPDHSLLPGVWINSNPGTSGIARLVISEADGNLSLQVYAIGPAGLIDWGPTERVLQPDNLLRAWGLPDALADSPAVSLRRSA